MKYHSASMALIEDKDVNEECKLFSEYQHRIKRVSNKALKFINEHSGGTHVESVNITERRHKETKLPKFELSVFSGDILKFTAY